MRTKRLYKYKKIRQKRMLKLLLFGLVIPFTSIFAGYVLTSLVILPAMSK